jgi:hypothetical protein
LQTFFIGITEEIQSDARGFFLKIALICISPAAATLVSGSLFCLCYDVFTESKTVISVTKGDSEWTNYTNTDHFSFNRVCRGDTTLKSGRS